MTSDLFHDDINYPKAYSDAQPSTHKGEVIIRRESHLCALISRMSKSDYCIINFLSQIIYHICLEDIKLYLEFKIKRCSRSVYFWKMDCLHF